MKHIRISHAKALSAAALSIRNMLTLALGLTALGAPAQYAMEITHSNGRVETFPFGQIQEVTFDELKEGVDYVDLGLPSGTLWATTNVGTTDPDEPGLLFVWGMTVPFDRTRNQRTTNPLNFNEMVQRGIVDSEGHLTLDHDAATLLKGSLYRTPTDEDWKELGFNCTRENVGANDPNYPWLTHNAIVFTGPNGHKLVMILPENYQWIPNNYYKDWTSYSSDGFYAVANRLTDGGYINAQIFDPKGSTGPTYGIAIYHSDARAVNVRPVLTIKSQQE